MPAHLVAALVHVGSDHLLHLARCNGLAIGFNQRRSLARRFFGVELCSSATARAPADDSAVTGLRLRFES